MYNTCYFESKADKELPTVMWFVRTLERSRTNIYVCIWMLCRINNFIYFIFLYVGNTYEHVFETSIQ